MLGCQIDHLVVTAASLELGAEFVAGALGVRPQPGGEHPRMGTHNLVLRLGNSTYLEVISPNPRAERPQRARWFGLDDPSALVQPRLATWVARTTDIRQALAGATEPLGVIESMSRGELQWLITIPPDGRLLLGGAAPPLIQWQVPAHPAAGLQDLGCSLLRLELCHPEPQRIAALLTSLGLDQSVHVSGQSSSQCPSLTAHIRTPDGVQIL